MSKEKNSIFIGTGDYSTEVFHRKSHLAKRVIIRINKRGVVELIIPKRVSLKKALDFLYKKEEWVLQKIGESKRNSRTKFENGAKIPILGEMYTIIYSGNLRGVTKIDGENLVVSGLEDHIPRKIKQFLVKLAKTEITKAAIIEAAKIKVSFSKITVRDTTSRWGSCSHSKNLSFSWRLVLAPREVLEYVVAHEIAHICEMNHSKEFWDIVAKLFPNYKKARQWLKSHGELLHSYD